ncbi:hypothetical protein [Rhizobium leguminosarum]|uniref:hypothetical protein n=1 Tax=Rhizobium leguminosarum TaxID=384 RepID=UPI0014425571|nr:hypothetical protein [Rhizobium leguminosarum]MBY5868484.1 hypothetical protein [Rhizobium leguminosarum]NKM07739.1 hypothetical protein [Rhizobium leguminosarum bv. viciae]
MNNLWTRQKVEADTNALFDAAKDTPQIVEDDDGHFILRFERGSKRPIAEWAALPGTLEDGDEL